MIGVTAQVSLYPLRQETLSTAIAEAIRVFQEHGLEVFPGVMSTLIVGDDAAIFDALEEVLQRVAEQGQVVMAVTFSNACPAPSKTEGPLTYRAIGYVKNDFEEPSEADKMRADGP
jgi:uncharacterized protein YqgV (UPF0045/DUF77 family)